MQNDFIKITNRTVFDCLKKRYKNKPTTNANDLTATSKCDKLLPKILFGKEHWQHGLKYNITATS